MLSFCKFFTCAALSLLLTSPVLAAPPELQPALPQAEATAPVLDGIALQGTVLETMNSSGYTYLLLDAAQGKTWVAIPETPVKTGQAVACTPGMTMKGFVSKTLNRTFDTIVFSPGLEGDVPPPAHQPQAAGTDKGPGFNEALQAETGNGKAEIMSPAVGDSAGMGPSPGSAGAIVPSAAVKIDKATGPNSYSVGECFEQAKDLHGKKVRVQGKVMKVSRMIMGKNWLHIQDGTGNPKNNQHDLVVTTMDDAAVDTVVTVEGTLSANRDFGAGYKYDAIVEDAKIEK